MFDQKSFLWRAYLFALLNGLVLVYPLYSIMFQANGLTTAQIGIALIWWSVAVILFQLPIGILSDRMSRRDMLIFGNIVVSLAFFIFMRWPTFVGAVWGFGRGGIKWAIDSVCFQPMVYDHIRNKEKYLAVVGTCDSLSLSGLAVSSLCSLLVFFGYDFLTWCTIGFMLAGALVLIGVPRDNHKMRRNIGARMGLRDIGAASRFVFSHPALLGTMGIMAIMNGCWNIDEWLGLIALQFGYPDFAVGLLYFLGMMCGVVGGIAVRGVRRVGPMLLPIMVAGAGLMLGAASAWYNIWATAALGVFWLLMGMAKNIMYADFQKSVSTAVRGRTTAILEIMMNITSMGTYAIMTVAGSMGGGYRYALYILGAILIATSVMILYKNRQNVWRI